MLQVPADFPHAGSAAFLRGDLGRPRKMNEPFPVEAVRVLRHNRDGTAFIAITGRRGMAEIASGNRTVERKALFATLDEAMFPARRRKAAA